MGLSAGLNIFITHLQTLLLLLFAGKTHPCSSKLRGAMGAKGRWRKEERAASDPAWEKGLH